MRGLLRSYTYKLFSFCSEQFQIDVYVLINTDCKISNREI